MKKQRYEILFEDDDIVIVNKPAGLLSIPDRYDSEISNLLNILQSRTEEIFTVHRLDKDTSGVMVYAKNAASHKILSLAFQNHEVQKDYWALISGSMMKEKGSIEVPLKTGGKKVLVAKDGKDSLSHYEVIENFGLYSLVKINIVTGRTHQIRVHFQSIGHPLMVDAKYGNSEAFYLSEVKGRKYRKRKDAIENPLIERTSLHAQKITLKHPSSNELMTFEAPLPKDMKAVVNQLRKLKSN